MKKTQFKRQIEREKIKIFEAGKKAGKRAKQRFVGLIEMERILNQKKTR